MSDQIVSTEEEINLLLEVAEDGFKNEPPAESSRAKGCLSDLMTSPLFKEYELDEKDVKVVAILFRNLLEGKDETKGVEVLKKIGNGSRVDFFEIKRLNRLMETGILEAVNNRSANIEGIGLFRSNIRLSDRFLNRLYSANSEGKAPLATEPYKDNLEYLSDQFERIRILKGINGFGAPRQLRGKRGATADKSVAEELDKLEKRIEERLAKTDKTFPFEKFKKKANLSRKEELIVIALLEKEMDCDGEYNMDGVLEIISQTPYERLADRTLLQGNGKLFKKKILETDSTARIFPVGRRMGSLRLNNNLKMRFLEEKKRQRKEKFKGDNFFEVIKPSVLFDKVILHPKTSEELNIAIEKIEGSTANILQEWGIKNNLLNAEGSREIRQSSLMLFYGPPGTGKTLAANAIAFKLGRDLVTFDCSKILGPYVGESEHNTRKIFDKYKAISKGKKNSPVLLLNEADQFLHRRINAVRSTDHMYNQMQNIFLEQLEKFEGILIATTNLIENLDSAFSRRFQHKIEFRRPGPAERFKLWQIHIPEKAPLSDDVELQRLADDYDLSGGQIAVVVQNAAARAAKRGDGAISMGDFIMACNEEMRGNFDERARSKVGF
ncbi:MAG: hypothetical protein A2Y52_02225 [Sulfuricurvum sp. RIFCSPLOWO2_02_43_6]|nr:MAG: hypothetical protein A2Y52_02225 [Sulfuricurvum sp. RIFCSPLOWO2_02_43_6]